MDKVIFAICQRWKTFEDTLDLQIEAVNKRKRIINFYLEKRYWFKLLNTKPIHFIF